MPATPFPLPPDLVRSGVRARFVLRMLVSAGAGAILGYTVLQAVMRYAIVPAPERVWILYSLPLLLVAVVVAVVMHELGHLAMGMALGGRFLLFIVGPLRVQKTAAGLSWRLNRQLGFAGGLAATQPSRKMDPRLNMIWVAAAGPLTSLLLLIGLCPMVVWWGDLAWRHDSLGYYLVAAGCSFTALVSGLIALVTLFPMESQGFKSDGGRVWTLLRGRSEAAAECALLELSARYAADTRPADFPADLVQAAQQGEPANVMRLMGCFMAYYRAADRHDFVAARERLEEVVRHLDRLPVISREAICAEYAWLQMQLGGDVTVARAWLVAAGAMALEPHLRHLVSATLLLAEGCTAEAAAEVFAGRKALGQTNLGSGDRVWALSRFEAVDAAIAAANQAAVFG